MDLFKPEQKLSISFQKDNNIVSITCKILAVQEDRLIIELPQYFMRYIEFLDVGCPLTVKIFTKIGTVDFNTIVISSPLEEEFSVELDQNAIALTPGDEIPVINSMNVLNMIKDDITHSVKTFEISTQYLKFYSDKKFGIGEVFDCDLILPKDYGTISFRATIKEIDPIYDNEITLVYSSMTEASRQALLYYMYLYSNNSD